MQPEFWLILAIAIFPLTVLLYVVMMVFYPRYLAWRLGVPIGLFTIVWLVRQGINTQHFIRLVLLIRLQKLKAEPEDLLNALNEGLDIEEFAAWLNTQPPPQADDEFITYWDRYQEQFPAQKPAAT